MGSGKECGRVIKGYQRIKAQCPNCGKVVVVKTPNAVAIKTIRKVCPQCGETELSVIPALVEWDKAIS